MYFFLVCRASKYTLHFSTEHHKGRGGGELTFQSKLSHRLPNPLERRSYGGYYNVGVGVAVYAASCSPPDAPRRVRHLPWGGRGARLLHRQDKGGVAQTRFLRASATDAGARRADVLPRRRARNPPDKARLSTGERRRQAYKVRNALTLPHPPRRPSEPDGARA